MKKNLEQLLNSLIEKGWKPRNIECKSVKSTDHCLEFYTELQTVGWIMKNERELVSKESGLWQFVCENDLYPPYIQHRWFRDLPTNGLQIHDYRYWVIESALCDEDKLEDFILDNVKVGNI